MSAETINTSVITRTWRIWFAAVCLGDILTTGLGVGFLKMRELSPALNILTLLEFLALKFIIMLAVLWLSCRPVKQGRWWVRDVGRGYAWIAVAFYAAVIANNAFHIVRALT